jgi:hypothetical protein
MTDYPALFQPDMVEAIVDLRKTQTRRHKLNKAGKVSNWTKIKPGDRLYVREAHWRWGYWQPVTDPDDERAITFIPESATMGNVFYGNEPPGRLGEGQSSETGWYRRPSIFLPKSLSRITLIVEATKTEHLLMISDEDAIAEGITLSEFRKEFGGPRTSYFDLWQIINGDANDNPEVVAVTFRVVMQNIEELAKAA